MTMRRKRPRDPIALANLIGDIATGQVGDVVEDKRDPAAVELGRRGGLKGGKARARSLSAAKRKAIA
ncbi:MAG: histone H1, partial [Gemmatimonadetes bacterium]